MNVFQNAPPPSLVDGLQAVPIHITNVAAAITFAAAMQSASATAEMAFEVGPDTGSPIFDLRQTITGASLDGTAIAVDDLAHHDFGPGTSHGLRIIDRTLAAGTAHVLNLTYNVDQPDAPNARDVVWLPGNRLSFDFHLSDLNPSRYLESWLPSNLLFDQFGVTLTIVLADAPPHTLISNGAVTQNAQNDWTVVFPNHFASCSHFLMIEADNRVTLQTGSVALSGGPVSIELMKLTSDTALDLVTSEASLAAFLTDFDASVGPYMHGDRFTAYLTSFSSHSMEYDGATTSRIGALQHEVFHSWWARGLLPATGEDGWLDEAWTTYMVGSPSAIPMDMADPPVQMWQGDPWIRNTHNAAYGHGSRVFAGIAAEIGLASLQTHMAQIYTGRTGRHVSTPGVEAELIRRSGDFAIADIFDRFVYGGNSAAPGAANLHLRDATDDTGAEPYTDDFWLSPDVWVRNAPDDGTTPQAPEFGQDNWLYARVHNRGNATARSFAIGWKLQVWAGTQFIYPGDWFPLTGAAVGFDLSPGQSQIIKTRWPASDIPPVDTHGCLLAMAWCTNDRPVPGRHVWEEDTLAQRNLTIVDNVANEWEHFAFRIGSRHSRNAENARLELVRPLGLPDTEVLITHRNPARIKALLRSAEVLVARTPPKPNPIIREIIPTQIQLSHIAHLTPAKGSRLLIGKHADMIHPKGPAGVHLTKDPSGQLALAFDPGRRVGLDIGLAKGDILGFTLCVRRPKSIEKQPRFDIVQRDARDRVVGGFSVQFSPDNKKECQ